jgi:hypothetical protein
MASENIYNWIQETQTAAAKAPMYRSKHDPSAPLPASTFGQKKAANGIGTFGRIVKDTVKPTKYLKGRERCGRGVLPSSKRKSKPSTEVARGQNPQTNLSYSHENYTAKTKIEALYTHTE